MVPVMAPVLAMILFDWSKDHSVAGVESNYFRTASTNSGLGQMICRLRSGSGFARPWTAYGLAGPAAALMLGSYVVLSSAMRGSSGFTLHLRIFRTI